MSRQGDTQTLVESFCALADEVQNLIDRKTILEHKLRFAAEQYQQVADKYAPTAPEVSETLANLQIPPDDHKPPIPSSYVPLPKRGQQAGCSQHQIALLIRDGRRAAQQLTEHSRTTDGSIGGGGHGHSGGGGGGSSKEASSGTAITTMSIMMEQDFTVEGKKGVLDCPFSAIKRRQQLLRQQQQLEQENQQLHITGGGSSAEAGGLDVDLDHNDADTADIAAAAGPPGTQSAHGGGAASGEAASPPVEDPICAALADESASQHGGTSNGGAPRCPIRFLDQHSPEEVAHYVETHKHQLPRSHAICLKRYNKNEEQIRKMDAKYGNLVNMISGLGQFHQPMLASAEPGLAGAEGGTLSGGAVLGVDEREEGEVVDRAKLHKDSHERVKTWANGVSASSEDAEDDDFDNSGDRHGHDDGQSANARGWRRSTAYSGGRESSGSGGDNTEPERESHFDRPLKEVRLGESPSRPWGIAVPVSSMPLDAAAQPPLSPPAAPVRMPSPVRAPLTNRAPPVSPSKPQPERKCPFDQSKFGLGISPPPGHVPVEPDEREADGAVETPAETTPRVSDKPDKTVQTDRPFSPMKPPQATPQTFTQPAFVNLPPQTAAQGNTDGKNMAGPVPQMLFTGPVFIGYPMEQAAQFLQMYHNPQGQGQGQGR
ncbi:hypothetical protein HMPREF1624_03230 [Sporothrix schenckii ATCC 58251]|uniref:Uncharacterized protein n=1 Tax=Sporothrix schenckii (strain ATCC 58251 / de Perez 2211183) TaxID=1391915 RepID=U7PYQ9_SPOS1|nr:hypothetical protein HMPREF1624_03230 [Sporothrix schenckii ATCC 58251]